MNMRRLLAVAVFLALVSRAYLLVMRVGTAQCMNPQLKSTWPCQKLSKWQVTESQLKAMTQVYVRQANRKIDDLPFSQQIRHQAQLCINYVEQKYGEAQVEKRAKEFAENALRWAQYEAYPRTKIWLRRSYKILHRKSMRAYRSTSKFMANTVVPKTRILVSQLHQRGEQLLELIWRKIEQSSLYMDVVAPQLQKIYDTVLDRENAVSSTGKSSFSSTASSSTASSSTASSSTATSSTTANSVAASSVAASSSVKIATVSNIDPVDELESAAYVRPTSTVVVATTVATSTIDLEASPKLVSVSESVKSAEFSKPVESAVSISTWFQRVQRTVDQAKVDLEKDAEESLMATIEDAKPEIMQMLRKLAKSSDDTIRELTVKVEELDSRSESSLLITKEEIYEPYDTTLQDMATLTFEIRDRVERLAKECLAALEPIRSVTLDSIDDFFEIVLTEVARELSNRGEWDEFKDYNRLKQDMKQYRASLEAHKFSMDSVNNALRESQTASLLIAKEAHQQLTNLRARAQLIFQEREKHADETFDYSESLINEDSDVDDSTIEEFDGSETKAVFEDVEPSQTIHESVGSTEGGMAAAQAKSAEFLETAEADESVGTDEPPNSEEASDDTATTIEVSETIETGIYVPEQEILNDPFIDDIVVQDLSSAANYEHTVTQEVVA